MTDIQAAWNSTKESRWLMADSCWAARQRKEDLREHGKKCRPVASRATVYRFARAGKCYEDLYKIYGYRISRLRKLLFESYFEAVAHLSPSEAYEWLREAVSSRMDIETFRPKVPNGLSDKGLTDIEKFLRDIEAIKNRPQFGGDNKLWKDVNYHLDQAVKLLREAGGGSDERVGDN